jgi:hypothetical protein
VSDERRQSLREARDRTVARVDAFVARLDDFLRLFEEEAEG